MHASLTWQLQYIFQYVKKSKTTFFFLQGLQEALFPAAVQILLVWNLEISEK